MAKKETKKATAATAAPTAGTAATPTPAKVKKTKAPVVLTDAQKAAQAALEAANAAARQELIAKSGDALKAADQEIAEAKNAVKLAIAKKKEITKALGIKGTFGGSKVNKLVFVKDFPAEGKGKGAPQARQILEIVKTGGAEGVAREKVVELMKTTITTNMDRSRLLSFYTSRMVEAGVITTA